MEIDKDLREQFLHKVKHDFCERLSANSWTFNRNGEMTMARANGLISADRFFMKQLGLEAEFKDLEDYYNPTEWEQVYDPDTASWKLERKEKAVNE